jgi:hypothetical protein
MLDGLDVWKCLWKGMDEKRAQIKDPLYGQDFSFKVYEISDGTKTVVFAAGEFSNCVWGFYQKSNI